jgi:tetratricopeptide (TPR) repeat protein
MAGIDAARWPALNALLDELLGLPAAARSERLARLAGDDPPLAHELQSLLALATAVDREGFLDGRADVPPLGAELLAGRAIGAYTLLAPLGEGGMGAVWLGERSDGRYAAKVAIKFPSLAMLAGSGAARFRREGEILARLAHPHIARLLDAGIADGRPYLVLEHVEGEPIDRWCDARRLPVQARVRLFLDVLAAVSHAHRNLILHRDLKPSNILVDAHGGVKLLDFGIAKLLDDAQPSGGATELTQAAGRVFTPEYAAPEQRSGGALTMATDVYALGVLLCLLLAGARPRRGDDGEIVGARPSELTRGEDEAAAARAATAPQLARLLRGDLDNIIGKCLKADAAERYASADALADELQRWLRHEPVQARADSLAYRAAKFVRRHRFGVASGTLLAVAIVAGITGTVLQGRRALAEAQAAALSRDRALAAQSQAEATADFLAFLLGSVPAGRSFTVPQLLERAEQLVAKQYADDPAMRARLIGDIGTLFMSMRDDERGLAHLRAAVDAAAAQPDAALRAQVECRLAQATGSRDLHAAKAQVDGVLARLRSGTSQADAGALFGCLEVAADIAVNRGDADAAVAFAREALALVPAPRPGQRTRALNVHEYLASALALRGQLGEALRLYEQGYAQLAALGRERTLATASSLNNWGKLLSDAGAMLRAADAYGRALDIYQAVDPAGLDPPTLGNRAKALAEIGRFDESLALFERALAAAARTGDDRAIGFTHSNAAYANCKADRWERCAEHLAIARTAMERALGPAHSANAQNDVLAGRVALARGHAADAARRFEQAVARYDAAKGRNPRKVLALAGLAEARLAAGEPHRAREAAQSAIDSASGHDNGLGHSLWLGEALLARARVALAQGDAVAGREFLRRALEQFVPAVGDQAPATREARQRLAALPSHP